MAAPFLSNDMKLPKQELNKLIADMLPLLQEKTTPAKVKRLGWMHATEKDEVDEKHKYAVRAVFTGTQHIPVNHTRALKKLIEGAKDKPSMIDALGVYLAANGKPELGRPLAEVELDTDAQASVDIMVDDVNNPT